MREILFRGKRKDNGKWVKGGIAFQSDERVAIVGTHCETRSLYELGIEADYVIPETVGQFTGLYDKNGKKVFEGDIVKVYVRGYHTICTVSWAEIVAHFQLWQINTIPKTATNLNLGNYDCEVIGNIHDNPELLESEDTE